MKDKQPELQPIQDRLPQAEIDYAEHVWAMLCRECNEVVRAKKRREQGWFEENMQDPEFRTAYEKEMKKNTP